MPRYDFLCQSCKKQFSKTLTLTEYEEGKVICPNCGSEEVEQKLGGVLRHDFAKECLRLTGSRTVGTVMRMIPDIILASRVIVPPSIQLH